MGDGGKSSAIRDDRRRGCEGAGGSLGGTGRSLGGAGGSSEGVGGSLQGTGGSLGGGGSLAIREERRRGGGGVSGSVGVAVLVLPLVSSWLEIEFSWLCRHNQTVRLVMIKWDN